MSVRAWVGCVAALALLSGSALSASAFVMDGPLMASLRQVAAGNFEAYNKKDINALLQGIDSRSPDYAATKQAAEAQFKALDVTTELVDFVYMGHDDEFAVARVKAKTTGKPGSGHLRQPDLHRPARRFRRQRQAGDRSQDHGRADRRSLRAAPRSSEEVTR